MGSIFCKCKEGEEPKFIMVDPSSEASRCLANFKDCINALVESGGSGSKVRFWFNLGFLYPWFALRLFSTMTLRLLINNCDCRKRRSLMGYTKLSK